MKRSATGIALAAAAAGAVAFPAAAAASPYSDAVLSSAPLSYLEMNETNGPVAIDSSPNGRHGEYLNAALGAAGAFNGSSHSVSLAADSSVNSVVGARSGSVQMWVKPRSSRAQQAFASHGDPRGDGWSVGLGARRKVVFVSGGKTVDSKLSLPSARWTMLTVTWDADKVRFYANGGATIKQKRIDVASPASSRGDMTIGSTGSGVFSAAFEGGVDDVALFPQPLTDAAIKGHFAATALPVATMAPTIAGNATEGDTLSVTPGTYDLETAAAREYEWQRCDALGDNCEELSATGTSYVLSSADVGATLQVAETASNTVGSTTVISEPTGVVQAAPVVPPSDESVTPTPTPMATTSTDPAVHITGTEPATATQATTLGTTGGDAGAGASVATTGSTATTASCARMIYTTRLPGELRKRMAGVGRVSFSARAKSHVRVSSPLRVLVSAKRGKLRKVVFRLDGKRIRTDARAPFSATIQPLQLKPGAHKLSARVIARNGAKKTLTLRLESRRC